MTLSERTTDIIGTVTTYMASALGYMCSQMADINLMKFGAAVLLIARLATDVPKGYASLKHMYKKYVERKSNR